MRKPKKAPARRVARSVKPVEQKLTCLACGTDERERYTWTFHRDGVERFCGGCGQPVELERTDTLKLAKQPKRPVRKLVDPEDEAPREPPYAGEDCPQCLNGQHCPTERLLLTMRVEEVRKLRAPTMAA